MLTRCLTCLTLTALPTAALAVPIPVDSSEGECSTDADCPEGMACEVTGGSSCACEPGVDCECPVIEYRSCVPGPCTSDADCGDGMICATFELPCASARPCSSDGNCEEAPPCESTTESICAPRWVLPCEAAADCGEGFTCEPVESCTCNGGGATDPGSPGDPPEGGDSGSGSSDSDEAPPSEGAPMPPEGECTCEPTGTNACIAVEVECEDDGACPSGWSCEKFGWAAVDCTEPEPPEGGSEEPGSDGSGGSDGSTPDERTPCDVPAEEPPTSGICYPPGGVAFDSGIPGGDDSAEEPRHESGSATHADGSAIPPTDQPNLGNDVDDQSCASGDATLPVAGVALLIAALWRRRRIGRAQ